MVKKINRLRSSGFGFKLPPSSGGMVDELLMLIICTKSGYRYLIIRPNANWEITI